MSKQLVAIFLLICITRAFSYNIFDLLESTSPTGKFEKEYTNSNFYTTEKTKTHRRADVILSAHALLQKLSLEKP